MGVIFLDSFDHVWSPWKWGAIYWCGGVLPQPATGRTGYGIWNCEHTYGWRALPSVRYEAAMGLAVKPSVLQNMSFGFRNPIGYPGLLDMNITVKGLDDGRLITSLKGGPTEYYGPTSQQVITTGEWYYLELYSKIYQYCGPNSCTAYADVVVRVNEEVVIDATIAGWTKTGGAAFTAYQEGWSACSFGITGIADDVYVTDNEFLGDVRIYVIYPNGNGDENQWSSYGAATQWECVDRRQLFEGADIGAEYIYTGDVGKSQLVNLEDIAPYGPIRAVQANYVACKNEAGTAAFRPRYKISGSYYDSSRSIYPSWGSWFNRTEAYRYNPVTGLEWTVDDVNSMQMGLKRVL